MYRGEPHTHTRSTKERDMDALLKAVVEALHASPTQAVLCLSGGASQAVGWLLSVPRASSTVLEVTIPYSRISMLELLGKRPSQVVSREIAEEIALVAYNRALGLSSPGVPVAGIGFTGALISTAPKRGDHRCHIAARTQTGLWRYNLTLSKGFRDREGEDGVTSRVLIKVWFVGAQLPKLRVQNKQKNKDSEVKAKATTAVKKSTDVKRPFSAKVERLRDMMKFARIGVSPLVYKKAKQAPEHEREEVLIKELENRLAQEGLSPNPTEKEMKKVKTRLEKKRDLDGIEHSNIVEEPRRSRASTNNWFSPRLNKYAQVANKASEDQDSDDDAKPVVTGAMDD